MNYQKLAEEIIDAVGGMDNIDHLAHCATRLRFTLHDSDSLETQQVSSIAGVLGAVKSGGQFQVIVGHHVVNVFNAIEKERAHRANGEHTTVDKNTQTHSPEKQQHKQKNRLSALLDIITGIFTPILPAITGAAMLKTLLIILQLTNILTTESQTYLVLSFAADAAFYFLPMMLAYSAAQKFVMNPFIGMTLAGVLLHPTFMQFVKSKTALEFLDIPIPLVSYGASVIPIILVIWIGSWCERLSEKCSPKALVFFMKPFLTLLIMVPLTLIIIAPFGDYIGRIVGIFISIINENCIWLLPFIMGIFSPIFIMTGMHYAVTMPIVFQSITTNGFDMIGAGFLVTNIAQGAAALAAARKAKTTDFKALANSAGFTALLGITEPALYGVNLKLKKPFYAVLIAGGISGLIVGLLGVKRMTLAPTGLTTLPIFIDPNNSMNIVYAIVGAIISFIISWTLTTIFLNRDARKQSQLEKLNK